MTDAFIEGAVSRLTEEELQRMASDPARGVFCRRAHCTTMEHEEEEVLTFMHAGWAGPQNRCDAGVPASAMRKVQTFIQLRPAVLHADEVRAAPLIFSCDPVARVRRNCIVRHS